MARDRQHPRFDRLYTELTYQPMQEVPPGSSASGYKTFIVTGGGQDFVREYRSRPTVSRRNKSSAPLGARGMATIRMASRS
jgi:hypothetical protein